VSFDNGGFETYNNLGGAVWLSDSTFIVAWTHAADIPQIMGRIGTLSSPTSASPILMNDSSSARSNSHFVRMATHELADRFAAIWEQGILNTDTLHLRMFSRAGLPLGTSVVVMPDSPSAPPYWAGVGMYPNADVKIVWTEKSSSGTWNIRTMRYSKDGMPLGTVVMINALPALSHAETEVAIDNDGTAIVVWESDESPAVRIRAQRIRADGSLLGNNFLISGKPDTVNQFEPAVSIRNGRVYVLWTEGNQIRGRIFGFNDNTLSLTASQFSPAKFELSQNYPNPFNPSTTIRYALASRSRVTLTVFNTLGQQVSTLVNETQDAGYHDVRFDGSGLASGVYFYRMQAGDLVQTKRLLILR
jgi:hypothetical protein